MHKVEQTLKASSELFHQKYKGTDTNRTVLKTHIHYISTPIVHHFYLFLRIAVLRSKKLQRTTVDFNQELQNPANPCCQSQHTAPPTSLWYAPVNPKITNQNCQNKVQGKDCNPPRDRSSRDARLTLLGQQQESFDAASRSSQKEGSRQLAVSSVLQSPGCLVVTLGRRICNKYVFREKNPGLLSFCSQSIPSYSGLCMLLTGRVQLVMFTADASPKSSS